MYCTCVVSHACPKSVFQRTSAKLQDSVLQEVTTAAHQGQGEERRSVPKSPRKSSVQVAGWEFHNQLQNPSPVTIAFRETTTKVQLDPGLKNQGSPKRSTDPNNALHLNDARASMVFTCVHHCMQEPMVWSFCFALPLVVTSCS